MGKTKHVGEASLILQEAFPSFNEVHDLTVSLTHKSSKGKASKQGRLYISGVLSLNHSSVLTNQLAPVTHDADKMMCLHLESLEAINLFDTGSILDAQDPQLKIKILGQKFKTER